MTRRPSDVAAQPRNGAEVLLYQTEDGQTRVEVRIDGETAWLSLSQLSELFQRDKSVISRHIRNVFAEGELLRQATVAEFATVQREGDRDVARGVEYFNLDVIISVGYRVRSHRGTQFRIWAAHGHTAAEIIATRADSSSPNMGLTWTTSCVSPSGTSSATPAR